MRTSVTKARTAEVMRRLIWRHRVEAARVWREAACQQAALHDAAIQRILDQGRAPQ